MTIYITNGLRCFIFSLVLLMVSGCTQSFGAFWVNESSRLPVQQQSHHATEMRYFGVSSFLIREGNAALMIDGFISRPNNALIRPIQPDLAKVSARLRESGFKVRQSCKRTASDHSNLDAVVAMHGHYDHALDAPLVAALTGAELFVDEVVDRISINTETFFPEVCPIRKRRSIREMGETFMADIDGISLTLVRTKHSPNLASMLLEASRADPEWKFPTRAKNLKEGVGVSAHVKTRNGSILIVPTAGSIGSEFKDEKLAADVIFLGIGALGWGARKDAERYWKNTVIASGARRVIPIHWDKHAPSLDPAAPEPKPLIYDNLDRTLGWLRDFANEHPDIELVSVPALKPFDPFGSLVLEK